ncbi:hypothetical protein, partial [Escherichia coli]|uniref:hypothetical protein n=1 Tax=Escherichia coli TaxID=562 RepID=UPI0028DE7221
AHQHISTFHLPFTFKLSLNLLVNKKWIPFLLVAVLAIALFIVRRLQQPEPAKPKTNTTDTRRTTTDPAAVNRNRGFDRRI